MAVLAAAACCFAASLGGKVIVCGGAAIGVDSGRDLTGFALFARQPEAVVVWCFNIPWLVAACATLSYCLNGVASRWMRIGWVVAFSIGLLVVALVGSALLHLLAIAAGTFAGVDRSVGPGHWLWVASHVMLAAAVGLVPGHRVIRSTGRDVG